MTGTPRATVEGSDHVDVVTHVHWDREWYRTFDGFRSRLVELVDAVLDQLEANELSTFLLDGQTSIVDDYLEVRPDAAGRLASHVTAGRLRIGPWYVLADKTLVSGESLIRNLLLGSARAADLGGRTEVGYCPDMFGHPPDLPMVLRGFGIGAALVWRGADPQVPVFRWRSPDGSEVLALRNRYYEPEVLWERDGAEDRLDAWVAARRVTQPDGPLLLLNGGDHLAPRDLTGRLADLDTEVALRQATLEEHLARLDGRDAPVVTGALREPGREGAFLLAGTLSVRPRQKRANAAAQALLEGLVEPLVAQAMLTPEPVGAAQELATTPTLLGLMATAWKHLLQGHPHDSVCGCGTDTVAADTLRRYAAASEVGEQVLARAARRLGLPVGTPREPDPTVTHVALLNATAKAFGGVLDVDVDLAPGRIPTRVIASDGTEVGFADSRGEVTESLVTDIATLPAWPRTQRHRLTVAAPPIPAGGWSSLRVELADAPDDDEGRAGHAWTEDDGTTIEGGHLSAEVTADGTLRLHDRRSDVVVEGIGRLVDTGDRGDTYNHDRPLRDRAVTARRVGVRRRTSSVAQELHVTVGAELPVGLLEDRDVRSPETTPLSATLVARLGTDADQLELTVGFTTDADDHRLRLHVPVPGHPTRFVTDSGFTWQEHEVFASDIADPPTGPGLEAEPLTRPTQRFVAAGKGPSRVAVLVHGHPEVAAFATPEGTELAVTLHRAVGQLGYPDLRARTMGAGPPISTPAAQEHGAHVMRCAVRLGGDDQDLTDAAWGWRTPPRAVPLMSAPATPRSRGVQVEGAQLSAWKPAVDGDGWIVRIANPTPGTRRAVVHLPMSATARRCRLDEAPLGHSEAHDHPESPGPSTPGEPLVVEVGPGGLVSWRVRPRRSA